MPDFFSRDYFDARTRFRDAVLANRGQVESIALNAKGPAQEDLTIDIGWFGSPDPQRALLHFSGLHGIDGFAGSAIQLQWLELSPPEPPPESAIAIVHILNPFGMAWLRRTDEDNIDLNCNFLASDEPYTGGRDFSFLRAIPRLLRREPVAECQYEFPENPAFGGKRHAQATRRFQLYIAGKLAQAEQIVAIDVRTGPGRFGADRLIADRSKGSLGNLCARMFPGAKVDFAVQQFGSCGHLRALAALRNPRLQLHAFSPESATWRKQVLASGREVVEQGLLRVFG